MRCGVAASVVVLAAGFVATASADWPNWRGPRFDGSADGQGYPTTWSDDKNVAWSVGLPGIGASTPIVSQGKVVLTYCAEGKNVVACWSTDGKPEWTATVGAEAPGKHEKASGANPSCVTDGERIYAYFKSGDLACLDFAGKTEWTQNLQSLYGKDTLWWDLGTSPVLTKDHVVVTVMQTGPSYLVAFDKTSGKVAWKQDRSLDAPEEAAQSYTTPVPVQWKGRDLLVVLGADHVTAHDATDGKEVWRVGGMNPKGDRFFRSIASPAIGDGMVIAPYARGSMTYGIALGGKGNVTKSNVKWARDRLGADVPTPTIDGKRAFLCTDKGELHAITIKSGKSQWQGFLSRGGPAFSASPVLADGKLYMTREDGTTFVASAGDKFKLLAENKLGADPAYSTPAFSDGRIYLRTSKRLYCLSE